MRATATAWIRANLTTQGHCLGDDERRRLAVGLRFSTGLCLSLVVVALALQSPIMVFALSGIGVVASFAARHPFDYLCNHGVRHLFGAAVLPANPRRRRGAFKVATVSLAFLGALFAAAAATAGLVLGGMLLVACALVTATNLSLPSETFAWLGRRRIPSGTTTITTRGEPA